MPVVLLFWYPDKVEEKLLNTSGHNYCSPDKAVQLISGGFVINGPTPTSLVKMLFVEQPQLYQVF